MDEIQLFKEFFSNQRIVNRIFRVLELITIAAKSAKIEQTKTERLGEMLIICVILQPSTHSDVSQNLLLDTGQQPLPDDILIDGQVSHIEAELHAPRSLHSQAQPQSIVVFLVNKFVIAGQFCSILEQTHAYS